MPPRDDPIRILRVIARLNMGGPAIHVANLAAGLERPEILTFYATCLLKARLPVPSPGQSRE